ncbi:MAG: hypothetical protein ACLGJB_02950 [Blastocatellia bacterium]
MSLQPDWLPALVTFGSCGGDWGRYVEKIHGCFQRDFLQPELTFDGQPLRLRKQPYVRGKEASFWHLVSTGNIEEDRYPDLRRCERIGWARAVIDNATDSCIKRWENERGVHTNICLWLESENYLVILGKRSGYVLLLTAYVVHGFKSRKLEQEYQEYIRQKSQCRPLFKDGI